MYCLKEKFKKFSCFFIVIYCCSSCTGRDIPAPIEHKYDSHVKYFSNLHNTLKPVVDKIDKTSSPQQSRLTSNNKTIDVKDLEENSYLSNKDIIYHEVQKGETIEDIAINYNQTIHDIVKLNRLTPPYSIKEFQVLKINIENTIPEVSKNTKKKISTVGVSEEKNNLPNQTIPLLKPVDGVIIKGFGYKSPKGVINKGINIKAPKGAKVLAALDGKVIYSDFDSTFGNLVIVQINNQNLVHIYAHLESVVLTTGQFIQKGRIIGYVGKTGKVDETQLYFGMRKDKTAIDPTKFFNYKIEE